jgi:hypothetical protein
MTDTVHKQFYIIEKYLIGYFDGILMDRRFAYILNVGESRFFDTVVHVGR